MRVFSWELIARSLALGETSLDSYTVEEHGCREATSRVLAGLLGTGFVAMLALHGIDVEPAWRAFLQEVSMLAVAVIILVFAMSRGAVGCWLSEWVGERIGVWIVFRATTGWRRYLAGALMIGLGFLPIGPYVLVRLTYGTDDFRITICILAVLLLLLAYLNWHRRDN